MTSIDSVALTFEAVTYLAIGLVQQQESIDNQKATAAIPLNPYIQWGWDKLTAVCLLRGMPFPQHLPDLVDWLHQPVELWEGMEELCAANNLWGPLLENGLPSSLCQKLGKLYVTAKDPVAEVQDTPFKKILEYCKSHNLSEQYSRAREFICRHPYLEDGVIQIMSDSKWDSNVRQWLKLCYERIPAVCFDHSGTKKEIFCCPRCGWPLEWRHSQATCYDSDKGNACEQAKGYLADTAFRRSISEDFVRTTRGIQQSVAGPEVELIVVFDRITDEYKLKCELWPQNDAYDLRIEITPEKYWAVDLKNHKAVQDLINATGEFRPFPEWHKAFYVIPNYRWDRSYRNQFFMHWAPPINTAAVSIKELLQLVEKEVTYG